MRNLEKAIKITKQCFSLAKEMIKPGVSEKEIARQIKKLARKLNAKPAFPIIVASGKNARRIHPKPTKRNIRENEFIIIDFGVYYKGARTDVTRTFCINPDKNKLKLYKIIENAQKIAIRKIKPGIEARKIDLTARRYIKKHTRYKFPYALGHGIGKRTHQKPRISPKSKSILKPGDIFTLEPGVHGKFGGIRIEDMFLLTKKGIRKLTKW